MRQPAAAGCRIGVTAVQPQNIEVKWQAIGKRVMRKNMHISGHIRPDVEKETEISTRFAGRVLEVKVRPGDDVLSGKVLCLIESHEISDLQAELIEARSKLRIAQSHEEREKQIYRENLLRPKALNEARTRYEQSKVHLQLSESEYKRMEGLRNERIAAEKDFLIAQAAYAKAKLEEKEALTELQREENLYENRALLRRDLQLAEAETLRELQHLNTLKQRLELAGLSEINIAEIMKKSKIVPILPIKTRVPGTVTFIDTSVGEMVTPEKHVFTVTDLSKVDVIADLPEADLSGIELGSPVRVKVASYPDQTFTARIANISDTINQETRTVAVRAILDNASRKFKMNMSADIYLGTSPRAVLVCPKAALRLRDRGKVVVVKDGKQFRERHLELGADCGEYFEVLSGLKEGEEVVTQGSLTLKPALLRN